MDIQQTSFYNSMLMTFKELEIQENNRVANAKDTNTLVTIVASVYFIFLIGYLLYNGGITFIETIINLLISLTIIYVSYRLKNRNVSVTITNRAYNHFKKTFNDLEYIDLCEEVTVDTLQNVGYIFTYLDKKIIYTSLDNSFKDYIIT